MKFNKLTTFIIVMIMVVGVIGYTYSKWSVRSEQTTTNVFNTDCLDTTLTESSEINLQNYYPVTDSEGLKLTPYTFSLTNNCKTVQNIQINLETFTTSSSFLASQMRYSFNDQNADYISSLQTTTPIITGATESYILSTDTLSSGTTHNYSLKLWIDGSLITENAMNKTFKSQISVITSYGK